jgi:hypothetical protein
MHQAKQCVLAQYCSSHQQLLRQVPAIAGQMLGNLEVLNHLLIHHDLSIHESKISENQVNRLLPIPSNLPLFYNPRDQIRIQGDLTRDSFFGKGSQSVLVAVGLIISEPLAFR